MRGYGGADVGYEVCQDFTACGWPKVHVGGGADVPAAAFHETRKSGRTPAQVRVHVYAPLRRCLYAPPHARTRVLTFVFGECALELVPAQLHAAPSVKRRGRERRRAPEHLLLDQALDHKAMGALRDAERRGRPDIVHLLTLMVQDSPLAQRKLIRVLWHTQDDALVRVRPDLRPPRAQATFYKMCEDLLRQGGVPLGRPLLTLERERTLADVLAKEARGPVVLLAEGGEPARSPDFARFAREHADVTFVLGAFPHGDWRVPPRADRVASVASGPITAASALVPVLAGCEDARL